MSHTRNYLENMIGKKVHLVLKNGKEYVGYLKYAKFKSFGFSIMYDCKNINGDERIKIGYTFDFVMSNIKKISEVEE